MPDNLTIFGASGQARETAELAELCGWTVSAFATRECGPMMRGVEIIFENQVEGGNLALGVGDPHRRHDIFMRFREVGKWPSLIHPQSVVSRYAEVAGQGTMIQAGVFLSGNAEIGIGVLINYNATIGHDVIIGDFATVLPGASISGGAKIGSCASVGSGSVVLPGIVVGEGAVIGAGAVVTKDVPNGWTVVGVPATRVDRGDFFE